MKHQRRCSIISLLTIIIAVLVVAVARQSSAVTGPDLVVTSLTSPANGVVGGQITISLTVANQGSSDAGPFRVGFYYSADSTITTADLYSGWFCTFSAGLAAGLSSTCNGLIGVPSSLSTGNFFLGAIADDLQAVIEVNENNNSRAADTGSIALVVPSLTIAKNGTGSGTVTSKPKGINCGGTCSLRFTVNVAVTLTAKAAKGSKFGGWGGGCSGTRTCKVIVNGAIQVTATFNKPGAPAPDLIVSSLGNPPTSIAPGDNLNISTTVMNQGSGTAGPFRVGIYFSTDNNITTGDILWALCNRSGLGAQQSTPCSGPVAVPNSITPGTYFLGACADDQSAVSESNEINNCRASTTTVQIGVPLIISVPTASAIPFTPLSIATSGLVQGVPVSVNFSNNLGYFSTDTPIRVETDGTVVVAVPLYIDPTTGVITQGQVSLILSQDASSSAPVAFTIQDLPTLSTLGTQLGDISHAMKILEAMLLGTNLGQIQAAQAVLDTQVDTSEAQASLSTLSKGVLESRNDIDRILLDNTVVITAGTLSNGTPVSFDKNSVDLLDRIFAASLIHQFTNPVSSSSALRLGPSRLAADAETEVKTLETIAGLAGVVKDSQSAFGTKNWLDLAYAATKVIAGGVVLGLAIAEAPVAATLLVIGVAAIDLPLIEAQIYANKLMYLGDKAVQAPPTEIAKDLEALNDSKKDFFFATLDTLAAAGGPLAKAAGKLNLADQFASTALVSSVQQIADKLGFLHLAEMSEETANGVESISFGKINGTANIQHDQGIASPQTSIELCCLGAADIGILGVADPSGNYDMFVPLHVPNTDYANMSVSAFDFVSDTTISSEFVDLRGLDVNVPIQVPTLTGVCFDFDATFPDGDDPDCD
jgi:hypothetical protein